MAAVPIAPARRQLDLRQVAAVLANDDGSVTMAQVAARIGMAKPTLYRLAGSKAALQRACVEAECERLLEHLHAAVGTAGCDAPGDLLRRGLVAVERYADDSPGGFRLLFERRVPDAEAALRRSEHRLADELRRGGHVVPELLAAAVLGAAAAVVSRAAYDGSGRLGDEIAVDLARALAG